MSLLQLNPTIPVLCKEHGYGEAFIMSDVSIDVNPIYHVRFPGGIIKHFYSDDIRIVGNPMNGSGWDVKEFDDKDVVNKIPTNAKRNMDFLKKEVLKNYVIRIWNKTIKLKDSYYKETFKGKLLFSDSIENAHVFYNTEYNMQTICYDLSNNPHIINDGIYFEYEEVVDNDNIKYFITVTNPYGQNVALYLKKLDDKGIVETTPYLHEALRWNTLKGVSLYVDEILKNLRNKDIYTVISHNVVDYVIYCENNTMGINFLHRIEDCGDICVAMETEMAIIFKSKEEAELTLSNNPNLKDFKIASLRQFNKTK